MPAKKATKRGRGGTEPKKLRASPRTPRRPKAKAPVRRGGVRVEAKPKAKPKAAPKKVKKAPSKKVAPKKVIKKAPSKKLAPKAVKKPIPKKVAPKKVAPKKVAPKAVKKAPKKVSAKQALLEALKARSRAAKLGWKKRREREEEEARKKEEAKQKRAKQRAKQKRLVEKTRSLAAAAEKARLEAEAAAKKIVEEKKARRKKALREAQKKRRELDRIRKERMKACDELIAKPSADPVVVWQSACWLKSDLVQYGDGSYEGEVYAEAGDDMSLTVSTLDKFFRAFFEGSEGWWMRVGVYGILPEEMRTQIDLDEYDKMPAIPGRPDLAFSYGHKSVWKRVGPTPGVRTKFTTAATMFATMEQIAENFLNVGFHTISFYASVYTGKEPPEG